MSKIIGYQIVKTNDKHITDIPSEFHSFEILSSQLADKWLKEHLNEGWEKLPIHKGEIEEPSFLK